MRNPKNKLERWEIALVKSMVAEGDLNDQDILAYFTRPTRSINHARIGEIRDGAKHKAIASASKEELERFFKNWHQIDPKTGLHLIGDELLIKAREAMVHAVQGFNSPSTLFKAEIFIVTAIIAWTYLMHYFFKQAGTDYRYSKIVQGKPEPQKTRHGAEGFVKFREHDHTQLWKALNAKDSKKGFGVFLKEGDWWWYESWIERVRSHCQENGARYG